MTCQISDRLGLRAALLLIECGGDHECARRATEVILGAAEAVSDEAAIQHIRTAAESLPQLKGYFEGTAALCETFCREWRQIR